MARVLVLNINVSQRINWFTRTSIFERILVASFLISFFPLLINIWLYFSSTEKLLFSESQQKLEALIDIKNSSISAFTERELDKVQAFASTPFLAEALDVSRAARARESAGSIEYQSMMSGYVDILQNYQQIMDYQDLILLDKGGAILFRLSANNKGGPSGTSDLSFSNASGERFGSRPEYLLNEKFRQKIDQVILTKKAAFYNVGFHSQMKQSTLVIAPVLNDEAVLGIAVLTIEQKELFDIFDAHNTLGESGEFIMLGEDLGRVVSYSPLRFKSILDSENGIGVNEDGTRELYDEVVRRGDGKPYVTRFFEDYRGHQVFSVWRKLDSFDRVLVVKVDKDELLAGINNVQKISWWVALASLFFVIPASFVLAQAISVPIKNLEKATVNIASGNKDINLKHEGGAEISALAVSFQLMALRVESFKGRLTKQLNEQQELANKFQKSCDQAEKGEAIISNILDNAAESMVTLDARGQVQSFNAAAEILFLWARKEALGQPFTKFLDLDSIPCDDSKKLFGKLSLGSQELSGVKYDKERFMLELSLAKVKIEKETLYTAIIRDITERKKTEYYLEQAKHAAEEASHSKTLFLANVSHELKTPMNSILGFTRRLKLRLKGVIGEQDLDCLETVHNNAENLLGLITDLLDLSTLDAGEMKLKIERVDVVSLLRKVGQQLTPLAEEKHLTLYFDLPVIRDEIFLDPRKVSQIAVNLLYNSIKYTDEGEICLGMEAVNDPDFGDAVKFYVRDTGIGIKEQDQQCLFKNFSQLDAGTSRERDGAGLGLAITSELVALHGGKIEVKSTLGEGSQFSVTLPRAS